MSDGGTSARILFSIFLALGFSQSLHAALMPNIGGDQAGFLPPGRFMLAVPTLMGAVGAQYDSSGRSRPIEENIRHSLAWDEMVGSDPAQGPQLAGLLSSNGVDLSSSAGEFRGGFSGRYTAYVSLLGVGILENLNLFVALPIIRLQTEMRVSYQSSGSARALVEQMRQQGQYGVANEVADRLNHGFEDRMNELGYRFATSSDESMVGDARLLLAWGMLKREDLAVVLQPSVSVPTGRGPDATRLIPFSPGTGRWSAGTKVIAQWEAFSNWLLVGSVGAELPFSTTRATRVPRTSSDPFVELPEDLDPAVRVSGGWLSSAQLDVKWQFSRSWSARTGVQTQHRFASHYSGERYTEGRYRLLDQAYEESLQSLHLSCEFFSLKAFLGGDFPAPIQMLAGAALPMSGLRTLSDPVFSLQAALFF